MNFYEYKGHTIYFHPSLVIDSGLWKSSLTIRYRTGFSTFTLEKLFGTRGEAVFYSITYGKELIDGGIAIPSCATDSP